MSTVNDASKTEDAVAAGGSGPEETQLISRQSDETGLFAAVVPSTFVKKLMIKRKHGEGRPSIDTGYVCTTTLVDGVVVKEVAQRVHHHSVPELGITQTISEEMSVEKINEDGKDIALLTKNIHTDTQHNTGAHFPRVVGPNSAFGYDYVIFAGNLTKEAVHGLPAGVASSVDKTKSTVKLMPGVFPPHSMSYDHAYQQDRCKAYYGPATLALQKDPAQKECEDRLLREMNLGTIIGCTSEYATVTQQGDGTHVATLRDGAGLFPGLVLNFGFRREFKQAVGIIEPVFGMNEFNHGVFGPGKSVSDAIQFLVENKQDAYLVRFIGNTTAQKLGTGAVLSILDNGDQMKNTFILVPESANTLQAMYEAAYVFNKSQSGMTTRLNDIGPAAIYSNMVDEVKRKGDLNSAGIKHNMVSCVVFAKLSLADGVHSFSVDKHITEKNVVSTKRSAIAFTRALFPNDKKFPFSGIQQLKDTVPVNVRKQMAIWGNLNIAAIDPGFHATFELPMKRSETVMRLQVFSMYGTRNQFSVDADRAAETARFVIKNKGVAPEGVLFDGTVDCKLFIGSATKMYASVTDVIRGFHSGRSEDTMVDAMDKLEYSDRMLIVPGLFFHMFKHMPPTEFSKFDVYMKKSMDFVVNYKKLRGTERLTYSVIAGRAFVDVVRLNNPAWFNGKKGAAEEPFYAIKSELFRPRTSMQKIGMPITKAILSALNTAYAVREHADMDRMNLEKVTDIQLFSSKESMIPYAPFYAYLDAIGNDNEESGVEVGTVVNLATSSCTDCLTSLKEMSSTMMSYKWGRDIVDEDEDEEVLEDGEELDTEVVEDVAGD